VILDGELEIQKCDRQIRYNMGEFNCRMVAGNKINKLVKILKRAHSCTNYVINVTVIQKRTNTAEFIENAFFQIADK